MHERVNYRLGTWPLRRRLAQWIGNKVHIFAWGLKGKRFIQYPESALAHKFCVGNGLEIGASAHNPFGLDALNVDYSDSSDTPFKQKEVALCGSARPVDIVARGDDIPLPNESQDFVVSSHVLEHFANPIKVLLEWDRLLRINGIIFMIVPHKDRTFDRELDRTLLDHVIEDYRSSNTKLCTIGHGHEHVWITEDVVEIVTWVMQHLGVKWLIEAVRDVDDKVGNGFTVVVRKLGRREASPISYLSR